MNPREIQELINDICQDWLQEDEFIEVACPDSLELLFLIQAIEDKYEVTLPSNGTLTPKQISTIISHQRAS